MTRPSWRWTNVPVPEAHLAALAAAALGHVVLPARLPIGRRLAVIAGWPAMAAGVGLAAWAVASASGEGVSVDRPSGLVRTGAFAVSRNPMYQGWALGVIGLGIVSRSAWVLAGAVFASASIHRQVLAEEVALSRAFATEYAAYAAGTPRYLTLRNLVAPLLAPPELRDRW